jgi:hypothetical protein
MKREVTDCPDPADVAVYTYVVSDQIHDVLFREVRPAIIHSYLKH